MNKSKICSILLTAVITTSVLGGCSSKEASPNSSKSSTVKSETSEAVTINTDKSSIDETTVPKVAENKKETKPVNKNTEFVATTKPTPNLDKMFKEEEVGPSKTKYITKAYTKTHATQSLDEYIEKTYDTVKIANNLDVYTKLSDSALVYHVTFMELANNENMWLRDIKFEFFNNQWNMTKDELRK